MGENDRTYSMSALLAFVAESNAIEGIYDRPSDEELSAYIDFRALERPGVEDLVRLVEVVQPGAILRDRPGLNVSVSNHDAPRGGPGVPLSLELLLADDDLTPAQLHHRYLFLHPFTDGNGRTARVLWLHRRGWDYGCGSFLQQWYYDSLARLDLDHVGIAAR